jgi:quinol monooxygenase YgiN
VTIVRIAEIEVEPSHIESYKALLAEQVEAAVRIEPGVLFLHAVLEKGVPARVRVIEGYVDQAAYEFHLTTPHFRKYKMKTASMVRSLQVIEHEPIRLSAKPDAPGE